MSPSRDGAADQSRAMVPARCGAAIDVPLNAPYVLPGRLDRTLTPGAEMFGFSSPSWPAPRPEKPAMLLLTS